MADYVGIANLAVGFLGETDQLRAPDDDSHVGRTIAAAWDLTRRAAIRAHSWNFATRFARLAAQAEVDPATLGRYAYTYPLPAQNLRLVAVAQLSDERAFRLAGKSILCDHAGPIDIEYLVDVVDPALWDDSFDVVMARRLAFQVADRITGDSGRKRDAWAAYERELAAAKRVDALENPAPIDALSPWEEARLAGYGYDDFLRYRSGRRPYLPA